MYPLVISKTFIPTMKHIFDLLLPHQVDRTIHGMKLPVYVFIVIAIISFVRSCIHLFTPDGGAGSIAGIDLSVAGADGIIFAFALWGSAQLIYSLIQLLVAFRYRSLVPLMYVLLILETLLREMVGHMKPIVFAHTPPGAVMNSIYLPLSFIMLILCLWKKDKSS
ncbi:hypothetical protein HCU40_11985 [Pseudanabaena biceps]|nr:hypothetical protein [Pseudanabaena biceps]